ncbi:hypothetical protein SISSUDRAFT_1036201 [Sistotremastrum suecicum HHB10207 ss-3]|uniref:JmjC domain-containing protein n=1 Tax=Sistotremastrum suecicum HHB10207 ss-3 TaxID=1314776 RepID=A0A165ZRY4_9AGAM|nr:hypothetical protein SISSUDRAFT_1036201 [Sistotremastrum suecicum HHB10207 ss-3]
MPKKTVQDRSSAVSKPPPANVLTLARRHIHPSLSKASSKVVPFFNPDAEEQANLKKIATRLKARHEEISKRALVKFAAIQYKDIGQTVTDPIRLLCLEKALYQIEEVRRAMDIPESKWDGQDVTVYVEPGVEKGWLAPVSKKRSTSAKNGSYASSQQDHWHKHLLASGIRMTASSPPPNKSSARATNTLIVDNIMDVAVGATVETEVINNVCAAALGIHWLTMKDERERLEFMRNLHAKVEKIREQNETRGAAFARWFNCQKSNGRNANSPVNLLRPALLSLAYGPSILLKGETIMNSRDSLQSAIADMIVPERQAPPMQLRLDRRMWRGIFDLIDTERNFYVAWNHVRAFATQIPANIAALPEAQSAKIIYIVEPLLLTAPTAKPLDVDEPVEEEEDEDGEDDTEQDKDDQDDREQDHEEPEDGGKDSEDQEDEDEENRDKDGDKEQEGKEGDVAEEDEQRFSISDQSHSHGSNQLPTLMHEATVSGNIRPESPSDLINRLLDSDLPDNNFTRASTPLSPPPPSPPRSLSDAPGSTITFDEDVPMTDEHGEPDHLTPANSRASLPPHVHMPRRTPLPLRFEGESSDEPLRTPTPPSALPRPPSPKSSPPQKTPRAPAAHLNIRPGSVPQHTPEPKAANKRALVDAPEPAAKRQTRARSSASPDTPQAGPTPPVDETKPPKPPPQYRLKLLEPHEPTLAIDGVEVSKIPASQTAVKTETIQIPFVQFTASGEVMRSGTDADVYERKLNFGYRPHGLRRSANKMVGPFFSCSTTSCADEAVVKLTDKKWADAILSRTLDKVRPEINDGKPPASRSFLPVTPAEWDELKASGEAGQLLHDRCVVILGGASFQGCEGLELQGVPPRTSVPVGNTEMSFEDWKASQQMILERGQKIRTRLAESKETDLKSLFKCLNLDDTTHRVVQDSTARESKSAPDEEHSNMHRYEPLRSLSNKRKFLNFLSLQGHHRPDLAEIREFLDTPIAAKENFTFHSTELGAASWVIAANNGVVTIIHCDANGAATWIEVLAGIKAWAVQTGSPHRHQDKRADDDPNLAGWETFILFPGDKLFMPPGTAHAVLTLETSVCQGAYVFPNVSYDLTLDAMIEEHWSGIFLTNTTELALTANFFRLWMYYAKHWKQSRNLTKWPAHVPSEPSFVALYLIITNMEKLTPQMPVDYEDPPLLPTHYKLDRDSTILAANQFMTRIQANKNAYANKKFLEEYHRVKDGYAKRLEDEVTPSVQPLPLWDLVDRQVAMNEGRVFFPTAAAKAEYEAECDSYNAHIAAMKLR